MVCSVLVYENVKLNHIQIVPGPVHARHSSQSILCVRVCLSQYIKWLIWHTETVNKKNRGKNQSGNTRVQKKEYTAHWHTPQHWHWQSNINIRYINYRFIIYPSNISSRHCKAEAIHKRLPRFQRGSVNIQMKSIQKVQVQGKTKRKTEWNCTDCVLSSYWRVRLPQCSYRLDKGHWVLFAWDREEDREKERGRDEVLSYHTGPKGNNIFWQEEN